MYHSMLILYHADIMALNNVDDYTYNDTLKPFNQRKGRKNHPIWRHFNRYERKMLKRDDDTNIIATKLIASAANASMCHQPI